MHSLLPRRSPPPPPAGPPSPTLGHSHPSCQKIFSQHKSDHSTSLLGCPSSPTIFRIEIKAFTTICQVGTRRGADLFQPHASCTSLSPDEPHCLLLTQSRSPSSSPNLTREPVTLVPPTLHISLPAPFQTGSAPPRTLSWLRSVSAACSCMFNHTPQTKEKLHEGKTTTCSCSVNTD